MAFIDTALPDLRRLDRLAAGETAIHRLDPRAKVISTAVFVVAVVSFGRYELSALIPFFLYPAALMAAAGLPFGYLAQKVALLCPFALMVGAFNPFFDHEVLLHFGGLGITGGWVSLASILVRAALTIGSALILVAVTGFPTICSALQRLGMPAPFALQLVFLYRYLFVLTEEAGRTARARELRSFRERGRGVASYGALTGNLLLRTWQRAERVHMAMLARGFDGTYRNRDESRLCGADYLFLFGWSALFIVLRLHNGAQLLGSWAMGVLR